ncbi:MAG TPA: putative metal-dependent hydrolase [Candidatus Angelobacter sp.]|nr:putative metal-dependent hydrolase [Candidatus Angelobacter sp.]
MNDPRYPIGRFTPDSNPTSATRGRHINEISTLPSRFRQAVAGLSPQQLDTPYRDGGWTVRQVVHHVPDSHLNAYIRCKWTLTEASPTIKPYDEGAWARLKDSELTPIDVSLNLLDAVQTRWVVLLRTLEPGDFAREFTHPEAGLKNIDWLVQLYSWHGNHHLAHVTTLKKRLNW